MTGQSSWRSLGSVMVATIHVAAVAYVFRSLARPSSLAGSLLWVPLTVSVAVFLSWPIGRAIARAFDPGTRPVDRTCPSCQQDEVRPLVRPGVGLFQPVTGYRCAACLTTFRMVEGSRVVVQVPPEVGSIDPSGIAYLSDPLGEGDIQFLDEPAGSPGQP